MERFQSLYGSKVKVFVAMQAVELDDRFLEGSTLIPFQVPEGHPRPVGGHPTPDGGKPAHRKYSVG